MNWRLWRDTILDYLLIIGVLLLIGGCFASLMYSDKQEEERWENGPCSQFADYEVQYIPARCLSEFREGTP
jgi:hypothetical protein